MCQVNEELPSLRESEKMQGFSRKCCKCKEGSAAVVIRAGDTYCRDCFKEYFIHKFRAMLGKNRVIYPGEKVLLAVSGGPSSCSMLRQVQEGLSQNAHKKLRFLPGIVYIDEGAVTGQTPEQRLRTLAELRALFQATGFPFYMVPLERVLDLPSSVLVAAVPDHGPSAASYKAAVDKFLQAPDADGYQTLSAPESPVSLNVQEPQTRMLQQMLDSVKTLTAKLDLLRTLRQHLLVHTARSEGYSKLMLGDSCTRVAVLLLVSISLGRGAALAQDTGFSDARYGDIVCVRPMRDYSAREIAYFNHLFGVPTVFSPGLDTQTKDKSSIQRLTESFLTKLQEDFPSTISTIYRTSEKLQTACGASSAVDPCHRCLLCLCGLDTSAGKASAFQSTLISEQLSQTRISSAFASSPGPTSALGQCCDRTGVCGGAEEGVPCCSSSRPAERTDLSSLLCYSCQLTVKDLTSVERLPQYVLAEARRRQRRSEMREQISDFLLPGDD
ncbi:cytoplasmic tRNA 2-thiolation protein 2 [Synchiropus splendidus]|uniref:cytoplasmic tRNA 2-thiolation protein 2 n=1 Tax=Synchiropus splendidus TaxID=270530 RepID=UPI00237D44D3|nr:cytoplasmic tRNA 2-thiolation protein 2 [Synchiropus splendidus]